MPKNVSHLKVNPPVEPPLAAPFRQITAEAAHDLNNALGSIRLYLDLMESESADPSVGPTKVRRRIQQMKPVIQHAVDLTQSLLGLDSRTTKPTAAISLNQVLEGMGPMLSTLPRRDVALRLRLSPSLAPVFIDPAQVIRIVLNLVLNACDAMPQGGEVMIETSNWQVEGNRKQPRPGPSPDAPTGSGEGAGWVMLRVRDTGRGMSEAVRTRAFQPFFSTKPTTNPDREAPGLGLPSVLRMVQIASGTIQVESIPGKGTEVTMLFPGRRSKAVAAAPGAKIASRKAAASCRTDTLARRS